MGCTGNYLNASEVCDYNTANQRYATEKLLPKLFKGYKL